MSSSGIAAEEQGRIGSLDTKTTVTYQEEHCCLYPVFDSVDVVHLLDRRPFSLLVFDAVVKYVDDNTGQGEEEEEEQLLMCQVIFTHCSYFRGTLGSIVLALKQ